jgi:sugar lactone lactonase YvrE
VPTGVTFDSISVLTQGVANKDFKYNDTSTCKGSTSNISGSDTTCTVVVDFLPLASGLRQGSVVINSHDSSQSYSLTIPVYGTGNGAQVAIIPGTVSTVGMGTNVLAGASQMVMDAAGNLYVADQVNNMVLEIPHGGGSSQVINISPATFSTPAGLAMDGAGNVYVGNLTSNQILTFNLSDNIKTARVLTIGGLDTSLLAPYALAIDVQGNLYIADGHANQIIKVVIAGAGTSAVTGAGSIVSLGGYLFTDQYYGLNGIAVDAAGNIYATDCAGGAILKIPPSGAVSTLTFPAWLTSNSPQPFGVSVDGQGNVYFTDGKNLQVIEQTANGMTTVVAASNTQAGFNWPASVVIDPSGILYVSDVAETTSRIVKVDPTSPVAYVFQQTGIGVPSTDSPVTYTLMNNGNQDLVFTASGVNYPIDFPENSEHTNLCQSSGTVAVGSSCDLSIKFIPTTGTPLAENVQVTDNNLNGIGVKQSIAVSGTGTGAPSIDTTVTSVAISPSTVPVGQPATITATVMDTITSSVAASGTVGFTDTVNGTTTPLSGGTAVGLDTGVATLSNVTLTGIGTHTITATYSDVSNTYAASTGSGAAIVEISANLRTAAAAFPVTLTFPNGGTLGSIHVLTQGAPDQDFTDAQDGDTCSVSTKYDINATCVVNVIFNPYYPGSRYGAVVLKDASGDVLATAYVYGTGVGPQVNFLPGTQSTIASGLNYPEGMAVDGSGNLFVAVTGSGVVLEFLAADGYTTIKTIGGGFSYPESVAIDGSGNIFVADAGNNAVKEILAAGGYTTVNTLGRGFYHPWGVAVDGNGNVFVADSDNNAVKEILAVGGYTTVITLGSGFKEPEGIAVDASGNVFVADGGNNAVKEILAVNGSIPSSNPTINTLGSGFSHPYGLKLDPSGNVFVADHDNNAVKEILAAGGYVTVNTLGSGFSLPFDVVADAKGNIYVSQANSTVNEIDYADPSVLSFGTTTNVGSLDLVDGPKSLTVKNVGNADLIFTSSGLTPATDFLQTEGSGSPADCANSGIVAAGSTCNLSIEFRPTTAGSISESFVLTNNSLNGTGAMQSIPVSGTGKISLVFGFSMPSMWTAGVPQLITLTVTDSDGATMTDYEGTVNLTSSDPHVVFSSSSYSFGKLDAGVKTFSVTFNTATYVPMPPYSQTVTASDGSVSSTSVAVTVNPGPAAMIAAVDSPTTLSRPIGTEFNLYVTVKDKYDNVILGDEVSLAAPPTGPSLIVTGPGTVASYRYADLQVYTNTIAGGPYQVTATAADLPDSSLTFTITNLPAATVTTLAGAPMSPIGYGTSVTLTATVAPGSGQVKKLEVSAQSKALATPKPMGLVSVPVFNPPVVGPPTGTVQFWDTVSNPPVMVGTATLQPGVNNGGITPGTATFTVVAPTAGPHIYNAVYLNDSNYGHSSTTAGLPYAVTAGSVTIVGPAQPVHVAAGLGGSVPVWVTGSVSGSGTSVPSGLINFTILNTSSVGVGSGAAVLVAGSTTSSASITVPSSLAPGNYTISTSYGGDSNFDAGEALTVAAYTVDTASTTINASAATSAYSTSSQSVTLAATVISSWATVNAGTVTFTVMNSGTPIGSPVISSVVSNGSAGAAYSLPGGTAAGSYTIQAVYNAGGAFAASNDGNRTLTVAKAPATLTLGSFAQTYTGSTLSATAITNPTGLTVTFSYNGSSVAPTMAGIYAVVGTINDPNYTGTASGTLVIEKATQAITFVPLASPVNYTSPIVLTASGGGSASPVTFSIVSGPGTISGNMLTISGVGTVVIAANQAGNTNYSAAAQVTQSIVSVPASLTLNGTTFAFGSVPLGTSSSTLTLIIINPNGFAVAGTSIAASGDFSAASDCATIAALDSCSVNIAFTPTVAGTRTGSVTVTNLGTSTQLTAALTGTATAPGIQFSTPALDFGSVVNTTSSFGQTITIQNTGTSDLVISNIVTTGDFTTSGGCSIVPAGSNCSLTVIFTPSSTGAHTGTITLTDNVGGGNQNQVVNVTGMGTQAGASLTPSVETFASTLVGSTSFPINTTQTNTGTAPLTVTGVSILGDFTRNNACNSTLAPAASCTIGITYAPTVAGAESGTLTVTDSLGVQTVALVGTGTVPGASLSNSQLVFGGQLVNTSSWAQTVVFSNTGSAAVNIGSVVTTSNFTDTTNCSGSVAPGASCSVNVVFTPTTSGPLDGTVTITDDAGTQVVSLEGQGVSPGLAISPSFEIFGAQVVGTASQAQTLTVTNTGTVALTLNPITVSNNFVESDQCAGALQPGAKCSISLSFSPTSTGEISGSLVISDASGLVSTLAAASGQGTLPGIATSPSTLSFGSLPVGTISQGQTVTVSNTGTAPLQIGTVSGTGDFTESDTCSSRTIDPGANCVISVTMTPTTIGTRTGTIQFNNSADGLHLIALSGMGQQAGVSLTPTSLAFGSAPIVSSAQASTTTGTSLNITIKNTGSAVLQLGGFSTQGDFYESDNCGATVAAGATCTLTVKFVPTALGHRTGTLTITDNAGGGSQSVSLEGDGSPAGLFLTPPLINFGVQPKGLTSKPQDATLSNNTGQPITDLAIIASGEYNETDNCGTELANGSTCTLHITVTPATTGAITGTVVISGGGVFATASPSIRMRRQAANNASASAASISNVGVVATLADTNGSANAASQLAFGTTPSSVVIAGGNVGSSITVMEEDSTGSPVASTDTITLTVTGPGGFSKTYTATASGGVATFDLSGNALTAAGTYTYTMKVATSTSIDPATASVTVIAGQPASVSASLGSGQAAVLNTAFGAALQVTVKDAFDNPVSGATVTFAVPGSGASAVLSSISATTNAAGTATITATANGVVGAYTITASVSGATAANFVLINSGGATAVSVVNSGSPLMLQSSVTFTATVSTSLGSPTGTVSFLDGTTQIGSSALTAGTATCTTSSLAAGTHSITAVYSGDATFSTATSGALAEVIVDFAVNSGGSATQSVVPGRSATFAIGIAPTAGTTLPATTTLTVTGLPTGATAALAGTSWTQLTGTSWQLSANTTLGSPSLTFNIPSASARNSVPQTPARKMPPVLWGILLLPFARKLRNAGKRMGRTLSLLLLLVATAAAMTGLSACGAHSGYFGQPQQSYDITVTVTAGTVSHSTNLTLIVE